jgi:primosomal protein N' (replication factor Y)
MYAKVAPLKRLPKHFEICDYAIPAELDEKIKIGQVVIIPFRKSKIFGLILSLESQSAYADKVKPIEACVSEIPFLSPETIGLFQDLASLYHEPLGSLFESALPPLQKRKIQTLNLLPLPQKTASEKKIQLCQYFTEKEHATLLSSFASSQTLIIVPEIHRTINIAKIFPDKKISLWHSEMSPKQKFESWQKIRNGEVDIIIGTRNSIFLTFFGLKNIILIDEEQKDHKSEEANPRFHVKDIARAVANTCAAQIIFTSSHPSCETYAAVYKHEYGIVGKNIESNKTLGIIETPKKDSPIFIDLKTEIQGHRNDYFLSNRVQDEIALAEQDVFIFLNRRGSATSIYCQSCGYKDSCPNCHNMRVYHETDKQLRCHSCKTKQPIPLQCPKCQSDILQLRGYGTENLEKALQKISQNSKQQIIRMDSDVEEKLRAELFTQKGQKIIIGTELSFQYLNWSQIELLICINLDQMLNIPEYSAEEKLWHSIQYLQYVRPEQSKFYIQTYNPEHVFWKTLSDPDLFYRSDLQKRKSFHYPPYNYLVKYMYGGQSSNESKQKSTEVKEKMAQILTKMQKNSIIYDPIELHPHFYRKKYWYGIIVLLEPKTAFKTIEALNQVLDANWKVDPRPNSILDP